MRFVAGRIDKVPESAAADHQSPWIRFVAPHLVMRQLERKEEYERQDEQEVYAPRSRQKNRRQLRRDAGEFDNFCSNRGCLTRYELGVDCGSKVHYIDIPNYHKRNQSRRYLSDGYLL